MCFKKEDEIAPTCGSEHGRINDSEQDLGVVAILGHVHCRCGVYIFSAVFWVALILRVSGVSM